MGVAAEKAGTAREQFMHRAVAQARRSLAAGGPPVGACLVREGQVIAEAQNAVIAELDVTAHAEVKLLRIACSERRTLELPGCELYVTVEPCLMCFSACTYAHIDAVFFGAPISAMQAVTGHELAVAADRFPDDRAPRLHGGLLEAECLDLLREWARLREAR